MASQNAARDLNRVTTLIALSSANDGTIVDLWADPATHRLLIDNAATTSIAGLITAGTNITITGSGTSGSPYVINSSASNPGTVTSVSVVSANGLAGSVATSTSTPAITLSTTITGILQGNGTAISAASTTGSGNVVLATSPALVTPALGAATATSLAIGGATLGSNGLAVTGHLLLEGVTSTGATGTGALVFATSPTLVTPALGTPSALVATNATGTATGLTSGITQALASATTTVNVSSATAPSSGQALVATSSTTATWQTVSTLPTMKFATIFETLSRFGTSTTGSGSSVSITGNGATLVSTSGTPSSAILVLPINIFINELNGNPTATFSLNMSTANSTNTPVVWAVIGANAPGGVTTSTAKHVGFKLLFTAGSGSLFATQADGTTENVSSAMLTGISPGTSILDLIVSINGSTATYYASLNGAARVSTSLTTNLPTGDTGGNGILSISSGGTAAGSTCTAIFQAMSYER